MLKKVLNKRYASEVGTGDESEYKDKSRKLKTSLEVDDDIGLKATFVSSIFYSKNFKNFSNEDK